MFAFDVSFEEHQFSTTNPCPIVLPSTSHRGFSHSKKQIAYLSPQLSILNNIPFAIPRLRLPKFRPQ
jgi:hypothetical protein